jgi:hypothetical protein
MAFSSSRKAIGAASLLSAGTSVAMTTVAITPSAVTAQNVARQPKCRPSHAPAGTPSNVATVRPVNMIEIADALRSAATRPVATTAPTPKNVPCASEVTTRAIINAV